ncbi:MAG TPA: hypothetical protein VEK37_00070, partial [Gemmatimonadaceae bacterium]|nr:hypothetical protein [Gemmatimonadaceae bacterium]
MINVRLWVWVLFAILVLSAIAFDLGLLRRSARAQRELTVRAATLRSAAWIGLALLFGLVVMALYGPKAGVTYLTAYLLEESLSIDNIFVFVLIFSYFNVPEKYQHRVLFWGIIGALVLRGVM